MSAQTNAQRIPLIAWPFVILWRVLSFILELTGRMIAIILGIVLMIVGIAVTFTVIGAVIGIPLALFGLLLAFRGFF